MSAWRGRGQKVRGMGVGRRVKERVDCGKHMISKAECIWWVAYGVVIVFYVCCGLLLGC